MSQEPGALSQEMLRALIRQAGLRSTAPRLAVLRHLMGAATPQTHAEIAGALGGEGVDRATIYRNLMDLTEAGLVNRSDHGDHVWRFEVRRERADHNREHPHFVCTGCGTVSCLPDSSMPVEAVSSSSPLIGRISEILIKGQCHDCA